MIQTDTQSWHAKNFNGTCSAPPKFAHQRSHLTSPSRWMSKRCGASIAWRRVVHHGSPPHHQDHGGVAAARVPAPRVISVRAALWTPVTLGRDYADAMRKWALLKQPMSAVGTVGALLDWYLVNVAKKKAPRTHEDNIKEAVYLRAGLGHIPIKALRPNMSPGI